MQNNCLSQGFSKDPLLARRIHTLSELPVNKRWSTAGLNATAMTSASCACTLSFGSKDERASQLKVYTSVSKREKKTPTNIMSILSSPTLAKMFS